MIELQNPALLRTCNYVDGQWIAAGTQKMQ